MPRKIGFITGTFDPVHLGHMELAEAAGREFGLDRVLVWVNAEAGHKVGVTPYGDRLAMVRLAVSDRERLGVYEGELSLRPHVPKTFGELARHYRGDELVYIVGADTLSTIPGWDDVETVVNNTTFLVAERGGRAVRLLEDLRERLGPLGERLRAQTFAFDGYDVASSSGVRAHVRAGEQPEALDARVYEYILANGLYLA